MNTISYLHQQIANCRDCNFFDEHWRFPPEAHGQCKSGIMVVGESSYKPSIIVGKYYAAGSLRSILDIILDMDQECYLTDLIKCDKSYLKSKEYIEEAACSCCKYLYKEIEFIKPTKIITVGELAFRFLTKLEGSFSKRHGDGAVYQYNKIPVIPIIHPSHANVHYGKTPKQKEASYNDSVKNILIKALNSELD